MNEVSKTSGQTSLLDTPSAISSEVLAAGATPCGSPAGPTTVPSGPVPAHASLSARQAKERGLLTSGTYGPLGTGSSRSAALTWSLASRLRTSPHFIGSILWRLIWRVSATPSGRAIYRLRASAPSTDASGFGWWPTPNGGPQNDGDTTWEQRRETLKAEHKNGNGFGLTLGQAAMMSAGWATPAQRDYRHANSKPWSERGGGVKGEQLNNQAVHLSPWATPRSEDSESTGAHRGTPDTLTSQSRLAGWTTPGAWDATGSPYFGHREAGELANLKNWGLARLADSGAMPTGSPAPTGKRGQLSPVLPCWLMGYPIDWILAAPRKKTRIKPE